MKKSGQLTIQPKFETGIFWIHVTSAPSLSVIHEDYGKTLEEFVGEKF